MSLDNNAHFILITMLSDSVVFIMLTLLMTITVVNRWGKQTNNNNKKKLSVNPGYYNIGPNTPLLE